MKSITNDILINMACFSLCMSVRVCASLLCASLADFMASTQTDKRFREARSTVGDNFLLLLRPSCLSFASTNKIKLNCLKIAKNEAVSKGSRFSQPKHHGYEPVMLRATQYAVEGAEGAAELPQCPVFFL